MRDILSLKLQRACTLSQFLEGVLEAFAETRRSTSKERIAYVSGIVSSNGIEHIEKNLNRLQYFTTYVSRIHNVPVFCAGDIFSYHVLNHLQTQAVQNQDFVSFWQKVLGLGYITDVFMTPGWELSRGASDEHRTAKNLKLNIFYLDKHLEPSLALIPDTHALMNKSNV